MGVLGKYGGSALKYYGDIIAAAYAGKNVTDMWADIRSTQAQYGLPTTQTSVPDVQTIRGYANKIVAGARAFAAADPNDTITSDMMAVAPYTSRDLNAISVDPTYHVRYVNIVQAADGTVSERWTTSIFAASQFPNTVGELQDAIDTHAAEMVAQAAQQTGGESGGTSLGTKNLEITLVLSDDRTGALPQLKRQHVDTASRRHARYRNPGHPRVSGSARSEMLACPRRLPARKAASAR